jgi:hypothetical protein
VARGRGPRVVELLPGGRRRSEGCRSGKAGKAAATASGLTALAGAIKTSCAASQRSPKNSQRSRVSALIISWPPAAITSAQRNQNACGDAERLLMLAAEIVAVTRLDEQAELSLGGRPNLEVHQGDSAN